MRNFARQGKLSVRNSLVSITVQVEVEVHLFTLIQLQYNNNKEKKEEVKNRANYTLN